MRDCKLLKEQGVWMEYGLTVAWLRKKRRTGDGPPFLKIDRLVRYRREDVEEFLRSHLVERHAVQKSSVAKKTDDSRLTNPGPRKAVG